MFLSRYNRFFERLFLGFILITLASFAYYFTSSDLEEVQARFQSHRTVLVKLLSREIVDLVGRKQDLTPRLANLLAEEAIAYAIVQQPEGDIIAKAEHSQIAIGSIERIEEEALKASHLTFLPFTDLSGTIPMIEGVFPIIGENARKSILRIGFFRQEEDERIRQVLFRNLLLFSTIFLGLITWLLVGRRGSWSLQVTWMGGAGLLILLLFLADRFTLQNWYDRTWRQNFVRQGMSLAKILGLTGRRYLISGQEADLRELQSVLELDETYAWFGVIKDDQYLYHSDSTNKDRKINDQIYFQSQNTDKPLCREVGNDTYEMFIPVLDGRHRLGTLQLGLHLSTANLPLSSLRNRQVLMYVATLALALFIVYLLSARISRDLGLFIKSMEQVTAGDLRQQLYLDRNDEFGQMAQAYNFMLMSLKERDVLNKGLQNYVSKSIVEKTMKSLTVQEKSGEKIYVVTVFVYFAGLGDAISRQSGPEVFAAAREAIQVVRRICCESRTAHVEHQISGILAVFSHGQRHETLMQALKGAGMICRALARRQDLPFSTRVTIHGLEAVHGILDDEHQSPTFLGESFLDHRALSQVQDPEEIIVSEETAYLIREVSELDELEISGEGGRLRAFIYKGFKPADALIKIFPEATGWVKTLVLKILKAQADSQIAPTLVEWFPDADENIRYHIMDVLERLQPAGIIDFVVKTLSEETNPRVLSKIISVLGKVGNESHIPILAEKLRMNDRRVKANVVEALESIGGKKVYEFLNLLVDEQDNRVKANILIALGKYGDLKVFDLLSRMIKDPDRNIRASAAYALGKLGMAHGVEPLVAALSDKDVGVRRQVVASLTALRADLDIDA
ncbi:MAG: HEAT repeat domain-containing protein [Candidatus Riflebacteria bacterium]|nr:HEAT repeat domain-containing protein [Candidatus Riflebacteria bacterium]